MNDESRQYLWNRRYKLKLRALMNRLYYQERQSIFEAREAFIKALSILAGSFAFVKVASPELVQWCVFMITAGNTLALVFGYGNKARDSVERSCQWCDLERDIEQAGERDFTEAQLNQWTATANEIEAAEPAPHKALLERCHARAVVALGGTLDTPLSLWLKVFPVMFIS